MNLLIFILGSFAISIIHSSLVANSKVYNDDICLPYQENITRHQNILAKKMRELKNILLMGVHLDFKEIHRTKEEIYFLQRKIEEGEITLRIMQTIVLYNDLNH